MDSWRVRRDGELVFADETRLEHAGAALERKAVGAGARALSTIVASAPNIEARLPDLRAALKIAGSGVESGASAFDRLIVVRLLAASAANCARRLSRPSSRLAGASRGCGPEKARKLQRSNTMRRNEAP